MQKTANKYLTLALTVLFFTLTCFSVWHHEIWLDEAHHYLLAKDSSSPFDILANARSYGHPMLWNFMVHYLGMVAPGIFAAQLLHCLLATACIWLIARFSPFTVFEKAMIAFSYFFAYEYSVLARNYMPGFLLIFVALVLFQQRKKLWLIAIFLGLAANMHLFTLFAATGMFCYFISDANLRSDQKGNRLAFLIFTPLSLLALWQIIPPVTIIDEYSAYDSSSLFSTSRISRAISAPAKGLFNFPDLTTTHFWNSNIFFSNFRVPFCVFSLLLTLLLAFFLREDRRILLLFFIPGLLIMAFVYISPLSTGIRYWGYFYVLFLICAWQLRQKAKLPYGFHPVFLIVLVLQFLAGLSVSVLEFRLPFSNAKNAATVLKKISADNRPVLVQSLSIGPSLSAYLNKKIYYPFNKSYESFSFRIKAPKCTPAEFLEVSRHCIPELQADTLVLALTAPVPDSLLNNQPPGLELRTVCKLDDAILPYENYFVYLLCTTEQQ